MIPMVFSNFSQSFNQQQPIVKALPERSQSFETHQNSGLTSALARHAQALKVSVNVV